MHAVRAIINKQALIDNVRVIKQSVPNSKIVAVVKANAYGHGVFNVATVLDGHVDALAVARLDEAKFLRHQGIKTNIILLEGFFEAKDLYDIEKYNLQTAIHDIEQVKAIESVSLQKPIDCWMKIDIGMRRLGASKDEVEIIESRLKNCKNVKQPLGLISHLSVADCDNFTEFNNEQIDYFWSIAKRFDQSRLCLANSAGILKWSKSHTSWVRPGIILYGISPFADKTGIDLNLKPVMTLKSTLISIRKVKKGDRVGYGAAWVAPNDTILGIVATGYGDGYPRTAPNGTPVLINNRYVYTAGHVCMDMLFVDLGADSKDKIGDEVTLWGDGLAVEKISTLCGTIPYELVCHIMPRVNVEYL